MRIFEDDDPVFAPMMNALFAAPRGTAVMSGCAPSATGTDLQVSVSAGSVRVNGTVVPVIAGAAAVDAGSAIDRYDLVSVDDSGSIVVTQGVAKRKCPAQPAGTCLIAIVFVPAGATVLATGDIFDARMLVDNSVADTVTATRIFAGIVPALSASDTQQILVATQVVTASTTYVIVREITIGAVNGDTNTIRVKFDAHLLANPVGGGAWVQVWVNDVARSDEIALPYEVGSYTYDVAGVATGDRIQIYARSASATLQGAVVKNVSLNYDIVTPIIAPTTHVTL